MWWFGDFVNDVLATWVVLDPISAVPVFAALTADHDAATRRGVAAATTLVALAVLAAFISIGQIVINAIGVSLRAFTISGGLILFVIAADLVIGRSRTPVAGDFPKLSPLQLAIHPLAVPTLAGPGAMLAVMLRTNNARVSLTEQVHAVTSVVVVLAITYGMLLGARPIGRVIGAGGAGIVRRVMGMILAAYAVSLVLRGLSSWLALPPV